MASLLLCKTSCESDENVCDLFTHMENSVRFFFRGKHWSSASILYRVAMDEMSENIYHRQVQCSKLLCAVALIVVKHKQMTI